MREDEQGRELLGDVLHGARMGVEAVRMLREKTQNPALAESLEKQEAVYRRIGAEAEEKLRARGYEIEK